MRSSPILPAPPAPYPFAGAAAGAYPREARATPPERLVVGFLYALPILWPLGLVLPATLAVLFGSVVVWVRSRRAVLIATPWLIVAVAQTTSTVINWAEAEMGPASLARRLLGSYVIGWYVIAACLALGASGMVRPQALRRGLARFGVYFFLFAVPTYALALSLGVPALRVPSPIGMLLPADLPGFFFNLYFFNWEYFLGAELPRLAIFFPWATGLGFAGVALSCIAWSSEGRQRRWLATTGAFMALASLSRLALLTLVLCYAIHLFVTRSARPQLLLGIVGVLVVLGVGGWAGFSPDAFERPRDAFDGMRPGASQVRSLVYEASWEGFREAPILGHGWPGESIFGPSSGLADTGMVPGSHSTISGLLYKGGVVTFGAFVLALALTALAALRAMPRSAEARTGAVLLVAIALTSAGEGIEALAIPTFWAFLWIGIGLGARTHGPQREAPAGPRP